MVLHVSDPYSNTDLTEFNILSVVFDFKIQNFSLY